MVTFPLAFSLTLSLVLCNVVVVFYQKDCKHPFTTDVITRRKHFYKDRLYKIIHEFHVPCVPSKDGLFLSVVSLE